MFNTIFEQVSRRPAPIALFLIACIISISAYAGAPVPKLPKPEGKDQCVEDTALMRKEHMNMLLHQRDETMYRGIRTKKHSLKNCISCHVVKGDDGEPVNYTNPKHFCVQCHNYASVRIDCFDCHASKPRPQKAGTAIPVSADPVSEDSASMMDHSMHSNMPSETGSEQQTAPAAATPESSAQTEPSL